MTLAEQIAIARTAIRRLRLTRWQLAKLIIANFWAEFPLVLILQWSLGIFIAYRLLLVLYRLYLHPLSKYPGPRLARVSGLWFAKSWYGGKYFQDIEELHHQYGTFVRTGPNELSIASTKSFEDIYAHKQSKDELFAKSDFYDVGGESTIVHERDPVKHKEIRRILAPGFTTLAVSQQEHLIHQHVDAWIRQLGNQDLKSPIDIIELWTESLQWFRFLTFDIIGELTFGEPFGTITTAQNHSWIKLIQGTGHVWKLIAICQRYPIFWPLLFLVAPANLRTSFKQHKELTLAKLRSRIARQDEIKHNDFFNTLLSERSRDQSEKFMLAQATLLVIAGADTTSLLLTGATFFLLDRPATWQKLRDEVRGTFKKQEDITGEKLQSLPYLNAVIEEALRLLPSIPLGLTRVSPGAVVDGEYVPKGIVVSSAHWTTSHSEEYFKDASIFFPERWLPTSHPDYNSRFAEDDHKATRPFSLGPRSCLGMKRAYLEIRFA